MIRQRPRTGGSRSWSRGPRRDPDDPDVGDNDDRLGLGIAGGRPQAGSTGTGTIRTRPVVERASGPDRLRERSRAGGTARFADPDRQADARTRPRALA